MTLLYLTHSCPYPPHKGDRIRSFNILKYLAKSHDVRLVYPSFTAEDMQNREELKKYCVSVDTVYIHKMRANIQCMLGFLKKIPLTLQYFYSRNIYEIVRSLEFDIAFVDCSSMAQYVIDIDRPKIIDFVDVDYEKWLLYAKRACFPKRIVYNREYKRLKEFENYINKYFDYSIVISDREKNMLVEQERTMVVSNGVDFNIFSPMKYHKENTIIFSGAMNYFANIDGVLFFYEEVFPLIKKEVPNAKFIIAGMKPVKKIRQLACQDVMVTGYVTDIRSYVAQSTVFIAPLRIAKGLQNKVLEAMAMEVPVVATAATNRGIGAQDHQEILVADSPAELAQATVALLRDAALRKAITTNAKRFVLQHYRWETNLSKLDDIIRHYRG